MVESELEQVLQRLRALFAAEYHRGEQDAITRIMKAAQGAPTSANGKATQPEQVKERAPKGTAKALIERVLKEHGQRGATPLEIQNAAATDIEKLASFAGIRFALNQGREAQRFRNKRGRWYLRPSEISGSDSR